MFSPSSVTTCRCSDVRCITCNNVMYSVSPCGRAVPGPGPGWGARSSCSRSWTSGTAARSSGWSPRSWSWGRRVRSSSLYHTVTENRVETSPNKKPGVAVCWAPGSNYRYLWSQYMSVAETNDMNMMCRMLAAYLENTTVFRAFLGRESLANTMPAMQAWMVIMIKIILWWWWWWWWFLGHFLEIDTLKTQLFS